MAASQRPSIVDLPNVCEVSTHNRGHALTIGLGLDFKIPGTWFVFKCRYAPHSHNDGTVFLLGNWCRPPLWCCPSGQQYDVLPRRVGNALGLGRPLILPNNLCENSAGLNPIPALVSGSLCLERCSWFDHLSGQYDSHLCREGQLPKWMHCPHTSRHGQHTILVIVCLV